MTLHTLQPVLTLPVSDRDHIRGPAQAEVTLVEYGDYKCPHCRRACAELRSIQDILGERLRLVFRNFPLTTLHPEAQAAAEAAEAAGAQGKFWSMHDRLFQNQTRLDHDSMLAYADDIGLEVSRFAWDLAMHAFAPRVRQDFLSGIRSGVNGTPTFFINGVRRDGPWDQDTLVDAILAALD